MNGQSNPLGDYSQALDAQLDLQRFLYSDASRTFMTALIDDRVGSPPGMGGYLRDILTATVRIAQTFFVTAPICEFLAATTPNMPAATLYNELLPSPAGFVYLDKPFPMPVVDHEDLGNLNDDIAAISWTRGGDHGNDHADKILLAFYARPDGGGGGLRPVIAFTWLFGTTQDELVRLMGEDEGRRQGVASGEDEDNHEHWLAVRRRRVNLTLGLLTFMAQRILMPTRPRPPSRATRKRAESAKFEGSPLVSIIEYRRREYRPMERNGETPEREYHVRWIVGASTMGFWRHYHTRNGVEARFVLPYEAGDPALPLKPPRATINVVRR